MKKIFTGHIFLLLSLVVIYAICGFLLLHFTAYYTDSPDTVFYLTIGKKYASGNFAGAINNYWSPFISWMLVPVFLSGVDPLTGFKLIQLLLGVAGLYFTCKLTNRFLTNVFLKTTLQIAFVPAFLSYALLYQTPDLLFLVLLLALFSHLLFHFSMLPISLYEKKSFISFRKISFGFISGLLGAFLYFAKAYGFPFFLVSFIVFMSISYFRAVDLSNKIYLRNNFLIGMAVFVILVSGWMGCLYFKYGTVSTGYASVYNFNLLAPGKFIPGNTNLQHPVLTEGLMDVSSREEASAWESPGSSHVRTWSPFASRYSFLHYLEILKYNLVSFYYFIISRNTGMLFIVCFLLYFLLVKKPLSKISGELKILFAFLFIYNAGYALIFFMPRYLWICFIMLPILTFSLIEIVISEYNKWKYFLYPLALLMLILFVKKPVKEILFKADTSMSAKNIIHGIIHPYTQLESTYQQSLAFPALIKDINALQLPKGKVAGISSRDPAHYSYTQSLLLCMYLDNTFYGEIPAKLKEMEMLERLHSFNVNYLYAWQAMPISGEEVDLLMDDAKTGFRMYKVKLE